MVTMTMRLGYRAGQRHLPGRVVVAVSAQVSASLFHRWLYWLVIIATTTLGTTVADFADRSLGNGYAGGSAILSALLPETLPVVGPGLPSSLLERRPDIQQAEQELVAATASIGVAESAYFPNIGLTAEGGLESTDLAKLFTGNAAYWLLQPALTFRCSPADVFVTR